MMDSNDGVMENNKVMSAPLFSPSASTSTIWALAPGFRFRPTDEELIVHYLQQKVNSRPLPAYLVTEINLYMYNPWELPNKALFGEDEWYFFSPIYRKYPNGERPNRAAGSGYWKATGTDQPIILSDGSDRTIGVKKALMFYKGRPPKGTKTDWTMSEYRIMEPSSASSIPKPTMFKRSMRLDDWVLCRVRRRGHFNPLIRVEDHNFPTVISPKVCEENYYCPHATQQASNMSDSLSMQPLFRQSQAMASLLISEYRDPSQSSNPQAAPFSTIPKSSSVINSCVDIDYNNIDAPCDFRGLHLANAAGLITQLVQQENMNSPGTPIPLLERNNGLETIILEDDMNVPEFDNIVIDQRYQTMYNDHENISNYDTTGLILNF